VGTGPFTTVASFGPQDYVLAKNPHYWQAGKPAAPCLERVAAATNDSALLMMVSGDVDWTHNFVPDVQDVYSKKDPAHFHYFYGSKTPVGILFDDTKYPYSLPAFRRAISLALDRQRVYKVGEYGYEPPADALGILRQYPTWLDPKLAKEDKQLVQFDPQKAHSALAAAGFTWKDGNLIDPHGNAVSMEFHVIAGWSDWVLSLQIIEEDLKNIGIDASVKLDPDWGTWSPIAYSSSQPHLMWTIASGPNPFTYFDTLLDKANVVPSGQQQPSGNWNHFYDLQATTILNDFRATASKKQQRADMYKLEAIFLKDFPYVPVVDSAIWYTYSTKYFTGWPDKKNDYANGIFNQYPDNVVILTRLAPVK
jgi:peptide/nickel transport system substrate-binding protein